MPTAGRLSAAVFFFIFGWHVALEATPFFPDGVAPWFMLPVSITVAVLVGWVVVGSRAGGGYFSAIGIGITAAVTYAIWYLFVMCFEEMISRALRRSYDGPIEGLVDVFDLMLDLGARLADQNLLITIVAGAIICALISEYFGKRYS